jgi:aryl-alcohol dehydrogenase-like predicted oxidoreductase
VVYQGLWNASIRDFEREIIPMCRSEGMGICAWGTLGQGRFQTAAAFAEREKSNPGRKGRELTDDEKAVSAVLEKVAERKNSAMTSVALAYCMAKAPYVFPIVGGRKVEHLKGNIEALNLRLSDEDIKEIEKGYAFDPGFPHTFLSGTLIMGTEPRGVYEPQDVWLASFMGKFDWVDGGKPIQPSNE